MREVSTNTQVRVYCLHTGNTDVNSHLVNDASVWCVKHTREHALSLQAHGPCSVQCISLVSGQTFTSKVLLLGFLADSMKRPPRVARKLRPKMSCRMESLRAPTRYSESRSLVYIRRMLSRALWQYLW